MACCCSRILNICKVPVCLDGQIELPVSAAIAGNWQLKLDYLGIEVRVNKSFDELDQLVFPAAGLNESYTYIGKLVDPSGLEAAIMYEGVTYDCIAFKTTQAYNLNQPE